MGLDGNPPQPGFRRQRNRAQSDRRPIGTRFLTGFLDFDKHTAWPIPAKGGTASQQLVGGFDRLDAEHETLLNDDGLTDIEGAQGAGDTSPALDVGLRLPIRAEPAEGSFGDERPAEQLVGADHSKALLFEFLDHRRQQAVVAERAIADPRKQLGRTPVGPQSHERGSPDATGQHQLGDMVFTQQGKTSRRGAEPAPGVRHAFYRYGRGCPFESEDKDIPTGSAAGLNEVARQVAASGDNPEPIRHSLPWADRWRGSNRRG